MKKQMEEEEEEVNLLRGRRGDYGVKWGSSNRNDDGT
jgi:hypothetical protein